MAQVVSARGNHLGLLGGVVIIEFHILPRHPVAACGIGYVDAEVELSPFVHGTLQGEVAAGVLLAVIVAYGSPFYHADAGAVGHQPDVARWDARSALVVAAHPHAHRILSCWQIADGQMAYLRVGQRA